MDEEIIPICNSTKSNLILHLQQPTRFSFDDDVEAAKHVSPTSEKGVEFEGEEDAKENEDGDGDAEGGGKADEKESAQAKVPLLYQLVEPGCTQMSCYASMITFVIMFIGVLALLMISPPFSQGNKKAVTFEDLMTEALSGQVFYKNGKPFERLDFDVNTDPPSSTLHPPSLVVAD